MKFCHVDIITAVKLSPSLGREWIEISLVNPFDCNVNVSLLGEGVD